MTRYSDARVRRIMRGMVEYLGRFFIDPEEFQDALEMLKYARIGLRDEDGPTCLLASHWVDGASEGSGRLVDCGKESRADVHSITRNGVLSQIAMDDKGGREVLRFCPDALDSVNLTKGDTGRLGSQGLWETERVAPYRVPISAASVCRSTCAFHDGGFFGLVDKLDLSSIDAYELIVNRDHNLEESLFRLGYRTLLYRMSQLRGVELVTTQKRIEQVRSGNRYSVDILDASLKEISGFVRALRCDKLEYGNRFLGRGESSFVHHIMPFNPRVRFAASEYTGISCSCRLNHPANDDFLASVNVLPGKSRSWLVVTYLSSRCDHKLYDSSVANWVRDFCATSDGAMQKHLEAMGTWTNLYCSPEDYYQLDENERSSVEERLARAVGIEPFRRYLNMLAANPQGADLIKKWEGK